MQPGCGHRIYQRVHIAREEGEYLVLGADCFKRRYGEAVVLASARTRSGTGRMLSEEERALLIQNTEALIAAFEAEDLEASGGAKRDRTPARQQAAAADDISPWRWRAPGSTLIYYERDRRSWILVQHVDDSLKLVPWPALAGWQDSVPPAMVRLNSELGAFDVVRPTETRNHLETGSFLEPASSNSWRELQYMIIPKRNEDFHRQQFQAALTGDINAIEGAARSTDAPRPLAGTDALRDVRLRRA